LIDEDNLSKKMDRLSTQIEDLTKKLNQLDEKMIMIESTSKILVKNSDQLMITTSSQQTSNIIRDNITDPTGLLTKEMADFFFDAIKKYQTTKFRQWIANSGEVIVEQAIKSFIRAQIPQLNWYGSKVTDLGNSRYSYNAKSNFPFEINTGIPLIGKIAIARINCEVQGDVDVTTRDVSNLKFKFDAEQPHASVFQDFQQDLTETVSQHGTAYRILSPIGRGLLRIKDVLWRTPTFSAPFTVLFLGTLMFKDIPPAPQIYGALNLPFIWTWFLGINITYVLWGILNGVIFGFAVWAIYKFRLLEKLKLAKAEKSMP